MSVLSLNDQVAVNEIFFFHRLRPDLLSGPHSVLSSRYWGVEGAPFPQV